MDGFNALYRSTYRIDEDKGTEYHPRFIEYMHAVQDADLTIAVAMTVMETTSPPGKR